MSTEPAPHGTPAGAPTPAAEPGIVVVGAGLAAASLARAYREGGGTAPETLVGLEPELPYERPGLSKEVLKGDKEEASVYFRDQAWYDDNHVDLRLGRRVVAIDRDAHEVELDDGARLPYRKLVLATGAQPRTLALPGADLPQVLTLRTLPDNRRLKAALGDGTRWVILGAGWIGLEVAAAAAQAGSTVTVLEAADVPLGRILGDRMGEHFAALHRAHGVDLRTGVRVEAIEGEGGAVTGVRVDGAVIPAEVVLVAVGAAPSVELAEQAGLEVDNGVVVDDHLTTSDPDVLAIGDVANAANTALGGRLRVEHWDNAKRQGKLAGQVLLAAERGEPLPAYDWQPYFYTDQYDLGMEYVGRGSSDDEVVVRGDEGSGEFVAFWLRDGVVSAAMNVNVWDVNDTLRELVGRRIPAERLADDHLPLAQLAD